MQIPMGDLRKSQAWFHFVRSNYVTWFTNWLLGLGGKSAHVVLICTTLYMSAQLYPGVTLPSWLNLTVFIVQMFALDMGGLGLASLARQAKKDKNFEGAEKADRLSKWLIGMMIAGLVTVSLEQAVARIPSIDSSVQTWLDIIKIVVSLALVVARAVCAVLYGRVVHDLESTYPANVESEISTQRAETMPPPLPAPTPTPKATIVSIRPAHISSGNYDILNLSQQVAIVAKEASEKEQKSEPITEPIATLSPTLLDEISDTVSDVHTDALSDTFSDAFSDANTDDFPTLSATHQRQTIHLVNPPEKRSRANRTASEKASLAKVRRYLEKTPNMSPTELSKRCSISRSYASELKAKIVAEMQAVNE